MRTDYLEQLKYQGLSIGALKNAMMRDCTMNRYHIKVAEDKGMQLKMLVEMLAHSWGLRTRERGYPACLRYRLTSCRQEGAWLGLHSGMIDQG